MPDFFSKVNDFQSAMHHPLFQAGMHLLGGRDEDIGRNFGAGLSSAYALNQAREDRNFRNHQLSTQMRMQLEEQALRRQQLQHQTEALQRKRTGQQAALPELAKKLGVSEATAQWMMDADPKGMAGLINQGSTFEYKGDQWWKITPGQPPVPVNLGGGQPGAGAAWTPENFMKYLGPDYEKYTPESFAAARQALDPSLLDPKSGYSNGTFADLRSAAKPFTESMSRMSDGIKESEKLIKFLQEAPAGGLKGVAALYSFVRAMDPGSVVKEGEINLVTSGASTIDRIKAMLERGKTGDFLPEPMKKQMHDLAVQLRQGYIDGYNAVYDRGVSQARDLNANENIFLDQRTRLQLPAIAPLLPPGTPMPPWDGGVPPDQAVLAAQAQAKLDAAAAGGAAAGGSPVPAVAQPAANALPQPAAAPVAPQAQPQPVAAQGGPGTAGVQLVGFPQAPAAQQAAPVDVNLLKEALKRRFKGQ